MDEKRTFSISDNVFSEIENHILSGILKRGELVTELKLCEQFGVSRTPVREALMRLRQEGLVEQLTELHIKNAKQNIKNIKGRK